MSVETGPSEQVPEAGAQGGVGQAGLLQGHVRQGGHKGVSILQVWGGEEVS